ncbi:MAG: DUF4446 family protein [Patescibacteria group bacterium]|nr:DUF4446 family protein [Patescibacteria group bacterium]
MLDNLQIWDSVATFLAVAAIVAAVFVIWRLRKTIRFQKKFFSGPGNIPQLEEFLADQEGRLGKLSEEVRQLAKARKTLDQKQRLAISHIGVVRFNSYAEAGGNNSFSLALLDERANGVVITSLYGRDTQRVYAKPLRAGESKIPLTNEEKQAILESRNWEQANP